MASYPLPPPTQKENTAHRAAASIASIFQRRAEALTDILACLTALGRPALLQAARSGLPREYSREINLIYAAVRAAHPSPDDGGAAYWQREAMTLADIADAPALTAMTTAEAQRRLPDAIERFRGLELAIATIVREAR